MSDLYNVARVLLSVLDSGENIYRHSGEHALLRAALAQQVQEPPIDWEAVAADQAMTIALMKAEPVEAVAWMVYALDGKSVCVTDNPADFTDEHRVLPLYIAPPCGAEGRS